MRLREIFLGAALGGMDPRGEDRDLEGEGSLVGRGGCVWVCERPGKPRLWGVYFFLSFLGSEWKHVGL